MFRAGVTKMKANNPTYIRRLEAIKRLPPNLFIGQVAEELQLKKPAAYYWCHKLRYLCRDGRVKSGMKLSEEEEERRRRILIQCAENFLTEKETGRRLHVTKQRISQLYKKLRIKRPDLRLA